MYKESTFVVTVIIENIDQSGRRVFKHLNVDTLTIDTPVNSLIILVHQGPGDSRMDVYVDCHYQGSMPFEHNFREMLVMKLHLEVVSLLKRDENIPSHAQNENTQYICNM